MKEPNGLFQYKGFKRWSIMNGEKEFWKPYNSDYFDTLALDGMFYIATNNINFSERLWNRILEKSGARFIPEDQQYIYNNIHENYHLGLFGILTSILMERVPKSIYFQHFISIRSNLIKFQERNKNNVLLGKP
jgi:hypothetical protein